MSISLEKLRAELEELGMEKGFLHPEVLAKSEELDKLLNEMNRKVGNEE